MAEGLTISARPQALAGEVRFEMNPVSLPAPLPQGLEAVGDAVDIHVDAPGRIAGLLTVSMRYDDRGIRDESNLLVFHHDEERGYEAVTLVDHDTQDNVIRFLAADFSPFVITEMKGGTPEEFNVGFDPAVHGWNIDNFGVSVEPTGVSLGMAAYAVWFFTNGNGNLHDKYDQDIARLTAFMADMVHSYFQVEVKLWGENLLSERRIARWLKAYLYRTGKPQLFFAKYEYQHLTGDKPHAMVVYGYDHDRFLVYDVDQKEAGQQIAFDEDGFASYRRFEYFGYLSLGSLGRTESLGHVAARAEAGFRQSDRITITAPQEGEVIDKSYGIIEGDLSGKFNKSSKICIADDLATSSLCRKIYKTGTGFRTDMGHLDQGDNQRYLLVGTGWWDRTRGWFSGIHHGDVLVLDIQRDTEGTDEVEWISSDFQDLDVARTETTVGQYRKCVNEGACSLPGTGSSCTYGTGDDNLPVNCVRYEQAAEFCGWAGARLPSRDEWITETTNGHQTGTPDVHCSLAVLRKCFPIPPYEVPQPLPVCSRPQGNNWNGLCDLLGNVCELTTDRSDGNMLSVGSSFATDYWNDNSALYFGDSYPLPPGETNVRVGFRCYRDVTEICDDQIDNDGDGLTDCQDTRDCADDPYCDNVECAAEEIRCGDTVTGFTSGASAIDAYPGCSSWEESGPEKIYILRDAPPGHVSAVVEEVDQEQDLDVFALENACTGDACKESGDHEAWFGVDPGKVYYIVVDGYQGSAGAFRLTVTCNE